ncbi:MAG: isoamylase early set domain-containing protein [Verrucomicrobia bacterium]|nr:isoamylase early set domain-containing protein [Verrucomicrobiota bacterium]
MNAACCNSNGNRSSAGNTVRPIRFFCAAPQAQSVYLVGDFNGWDSAANPMRRQADGWWFLQVPLTHGHHHYRFLVDGKPMLDPKAAGIARDEWGERASLVAVS